jgi:hypothetical protein
MGHAYDGWDTKPKLDEARVLAPESAPHRSRKNTRKWCRGKPGVVHQPEIRLSKWGQYMLARYGRENLRGICGWETQHRWDVVAGERRWVPRNEWHYDCRHEYVCSACGKILRDAHGSECPEFKPLAADPKCRCYTCAKYA